MTTCRVNERELITLEGLHCIHYPNIIHAHTLNVSLAGGEFHS